MAETKRRFYTKTFTKATFFQTVAQIVAGEDVEDEMLDLVAQACDYELDGIATKADARGTGERKDPLQSDYAQALAAAIVPLVPAAGANAPLTAKELVALATTKGNLSPKGTEWAPPWVSRVLNVTASVVAVKKVVERKDAKGLVSQVEVTAYQRA